MSRWKKKIRKKEKSLFDCCRYCCDENQIFLSSHFYDFLKTIVVFLPQRESLFFSFVFNSCNKHWLWEDQNLERGKKESLITKKKEQEKSHLVLRRAARNFLVLFPKFFIVFLVKERIAWKRKKKLSFSLAIKAAHCDIIRIPFFTRFHLRAREILFIFFLSFLSFSFFFFLFLSLCLSFFLPSSPCDPWKTKWEEGKRFKNNIWFARTFCSVWFNSVKVPLFFLPSSSSSFQKFLSFAQSPASLLKELKFMSFLPSPLASFRLRCLFLFLLLSFLSLSFSFFFLFRTFPFLLLRFLAAAATTSANHFADNLIRLKKRELERVMSCSRSLT